MRWNTGAHPHTDKHGVGKHGFQAGNPGTGTPASIDDAVVYDDLFANVAYLCDEMGFLTLGRKQDLSDAVAAKAAAATSMGAGTIVATFRNAPGGRELACNGAAVSRTTYAALFAAIGTTFGVGDGATTFNLPDLRGEFLRGLDAGRGVDSGRVLGSAQLDAFQGHEHGMEFPHGVSGTPGFLDGDNASNNGVSSSTTITTKSGYAAPRVAQETRPRNVAINFFIRY